jgi:drug/metabolite transporter, DME family
MRSTRSHGLALVALGAAIWGTDALLRRGMAIELSAAVVVFMEHVILAAITFPIALGAIRRRPGFTKRDVAALVLVGAGASALATVLFTRAFVYGDPTTPLLLQKLQPLFVLPAAHLLLSERLTPNFAIFFCFGVGGAYLITFPDPMTITFDSVVAASLAVGAAMLWAMGTVLGRHLSGLLSFKELTALRFAIGLPASAVILLVVGEAGTIGTLRGSDLFGLLLLALIPGLLALMIYYRGLRDSPASAAAVAELAFPLSAIIVNRFAFDAVLTATQWVGLVVLSGTIVTMTVLASRSTRLVGVVGGSEGVWRPQPQARGS